MFFFPVSFLGNTDPVTKALRSQKFVKTCPITPPHWSDFMSDLKILFRLRWLEVVSLLTFPSIVIFLYPRILPWISKPY